MNYLNFALILAILGSLSTLHVHSAPGVTLPTAENQSSDETTTEIITPTSEISSENDFNSTNDTGLVLQIKTSCAKYSKSKDTSKDEKTFTFCQNGKCCSTGALPAQNERCKLNKYKSKEIGDCALFEFVSDPVKGNVTNSDLASATDGWTPEWVKLLLKDGTVIKCSFNGRIDGDDETEPTSLDFGCKPEEKVSIDSSSKDHLKVDETRAKACNGGVSCLKPVDGNNSTKIETVGKKNSSSMEHPNLASPSTTTQTVGSNPDSNIAITTIATTNATISTTSATKETTEPSVQANSSTTGPIVDSSSKSTTKFDGWSFFGGIIVTIGTASIAFVGVKYYQARNIRSQNYNLM